jgi:SAM-dependent methyltransferase
MTANSFDSRVYSLRSGETPEALGVVKSRLDKLLPWYTTFLKQWLPEQTDSRILDVPCGVGNLLNCLVSLGYTNVQGVDSDAGQVQMANRLGLPARLGDAFEFLGSTAENSTDRIFALDFVEHVEAERATEFCSQSWRALKPGGILIMRTPSADGPVGAADRFNDLTHKWSATSSAILPILLLAGFDLSAIQIRQEAPVPYKWENWVRLALFSATTRLMGAWLELIGLGAPAVWTRSMWIFARK